MLRMYVEDFLDVVNVCLFRDGCLVECFLIQNVVIVVFQISAVFLNALLKQTFC